MVMMNTNHPECQALAFERDEMVDLQIRGRGISSPSVLAVMKQIPRHFFVPENMRKAAYYDCPLQIGFNQTISQPYIVALMTDLLHLTGKEKVLEIGTGSGYQTAILAELADHVFSLELESHFVKPAQSRLTDLGIFNVSILQMDGSSGYAAEAPYDRIIVTAGAPAVPPLLMEQLAANGRMVIPVGDRVTQTLQIWKKDTDGHPSCDEHISVVFVPLRGKFGWF
jgi:protein-L-isoaspartate(D-aspartate) O-methyltransferase